MTASRRPIVECLEDRCVPVTWGNPWPDATQLTLSFAPDGTAVGDRTSSLFSVLNQAGTTAAWQREVLRAFQTWAVHANINIGLVADSGVRFGSWGRPQGDARFGDIRLAGYGMSSEVMAVSSPFETTAGTWSGDLKLNTRTPFSLGGGAGTVDLFTALLHEAAHVLGLDHSEDTASAVFEHYLVPKAGLTAGDIASLQSLYGARGADDYEGTGGNGTLGTARRLNLLANPDGSLGITANADITTGSDVDVYRFQAPLNVGALDVRLRTAGLSLLGARVTVYNGFGQVVGSAVSTGPGADLSVRVNSLLPLGTYYVKVEGATDDVFGIGSYCLEAKALPLVGTVTGAVGDAVDQAQTLLADDLHTNDTILTASLLPSLSATPSRFDAAFRGSVRDSWDVDYYRIQSPAGTSVLTAMVWGIDNALAPRVRVFDAQGQPVAAEVLVNKDGIFTVQVRDTTPGAAYFVKVEAASSGSTTGNYFLGVDFSNKAVEMTTVAEGTLDAAEPQRTGRLVLPRSGLLHFVLSAESAGASRVQFTIRDQSGAVVLNLEAQSGRDPVSATVDLPAGEYTVEVRAVSSDNSALLTTTFRLLGIYLDDPIGPRPEDTTDSSSGSPPPPSSSDPPPDDTSTSDGTTNEDDTWEWWWGGDNRGLQGEEPPNDPYQAG